jgi:predicted ATPase
VLEAQFPETAETQPELLAHHYTEGGLYEPAIDYWKRAGQRAIECSAYVEAIMHLTKGLEVVKTLSASRNCARQELDLRTALGRALMATKGYAAPEVEDVYARARELCQQIGDTPELFHMLRTMCAVYTNRGEFATAHELAVQCLTLAQHVQDHVLLNDHDFDQSGFPVLVGGRDCLRGLGAL